jgi:hypothetical protein
LPLHSALPAGVLQVTVPAAFVVRVLTPFVRVAEEKSKISTKAELQIWGGGKGGWHFPWKGGWHLFVLLLARRQGSRGEGTSFPERFRAPAFTTRKRWLAPFSARLSTIVPMN